MRHRLNLTRPLTLGNTSYCQPILSDCDGMLQVSISGQALVFVVRTISWSFMSRAGSLTYIAFFGAQARPLYAFICPFVLYRNSAVSIP